MITFFLYRTDVVIKLCGLTVIGLWGTVALLTSHNHKPYNRKTA